MDNTPKTCVRCGNRTPDPSSGYCVFCGAPFTTQKSKPSLICHEFTKNDMIGIVIVALVTIVVAIYNIYCSMDNLKYFKEYEEDLTLIQEMIEDGEVPDDITPTEWEEVTNAVKFYEFYSILDPIEIALYSVLLVSAVLMLLRFRFAFKTTLAFYIITTITYVIYLMYQVIQGDIEVLEGIIWIVIIRIGVIKMLIGMVLSTSGRNAMPTPAVAVAPVGNVPLVPTERADMAIDPVTGKTIQSGGSPMPAMLQKQPQNAQQPVYTTNNIQSVAPVAPTAAPQPAPVQTSAPMMGSAQESAASSAADWQCKGCGFMNSASSAFCVFCGSERK